MRLYVPVCVLCIRHRHGILVKDSYRPHFLSDSLDRTGATGYIIGVGGVLPPRLRPWRLYADAL